MGNALQTAIDPAVAARELLARRGARKGLMGYILYNNSKFKVSAFSTSLCDAIDKFIVRVENGERPILIIQAPPQHGKSEIVSRNLPSYLMGRFPDWHSGCVGYSDTFAKEFGQDVRRIIFDVPHGNLFPIAEMSRIKRKYKVSRMGQITALNGIGGYRACGVGGGLTGKPLTIGIIDDPIKNADEALSKIIKESHWNWYQTVFTSRMQENSGQIIMATSWAEDDLAARIAKHYAGDSRLTILRFPAINAPDEVGYNPELPLGALVPELHSLKKLLETKGLYSDYWWSAMYQQSPKALGGNVFKEEFVQYYLPKDLPKKFDKVIASWDCTFKDTDGTDFVVGQVWGKVGADAYLLDQVRARMSFTKTTAEVVVLREKHSLTREVLIEDKANGPAVIDVLKKYVPGIIPIEPDGSKLARAHAVTSFWEARNVHIPHPESAPWVKAYVSEMTHFPNAAHDDQVDATTQALRRLFPLLGKLNISQAALDKAMGRV